MKVYAAKEKRLVKLQLTPSPSIGIDGKADPLLDEGNVKITKKIDRLVCYNKITKMGLGGAPLAERKEYKS